MDLSTQIHSDMDIELLKRTPSAFLGSCRYKLPEIHENPEIYEKIFAILDKLDIEAFIYIGGNDSMDTIKKLSDYAIIKGHSQKFLGVPKTCLLYTSTLKGIWIIYPFSFFSILDSKKYLMLIPPNTYWLNYNH